MGCVRRPGWLAPGLCVVMMGCALDTTGIGTAEQPPVAPPVEQMDLLGELDLTPGVEATLTDDVGCIAADRDGRRYLFCTTPMDWDEARAFCADAGYDLVVIDDADEDTWVWDQMAALTLVDWWIGLSDATTEGEFVWVDDTLAWSGGTAGTAVGYTHFRRSGAPDGGGNCVELDESSTLWHDEVCTLPNPFVCETVAP